MSKRPQTVVNVNLPGHTARTPPLGAPVTPKSMDAAFFCWLFLGGFGLHRFYLRRRHAKTMLGLGLATVSLVLFGIGALLLFGIGVWWLADLFFLPRWVAEHNARLIPPGGVSASGRAAGAGARRREEAVDLRTLLLRAAERRSGRLTVTQGVMATGESFDDVRSCLQWMVVNGHADADNDPDSGAVVYVFPELA